jgi:hypothetical protein
MARGRNRLNVTLDDQYAEKLSRLAALFRRGHSPR